MRILIIEGDFGVRLLLERHLTGRGYDVDVSANAEEAIKLAEEKTPSLVIMDIMAFGIDNRIVSTIRELSPSAKFIVISGVIEGHESDFSLELIDYLIKKPFDLNAITKLADKVLKNCNN